MCTPPCSQDKASPSCCDRLRPTQAPYPRQQGCKLVPTGAALPREGRRLWENNAQEIVWGHNGSSPPPRALYHHIHTITCAPQIPSQIS